MGELMDPVGIVSKDCYDPFRLLLLPGRSGSVSYAIRPSFITAIPSYNDSLSTCVFLRTRTLLKAKKVIMIIAHLIDRCLCTRRVDCLTSSPPHHPPATRLDEFLTSGFVANP